VIGLCWIVTREVGSGRELTLSIGYRPSVRRFLPHRRLTVAQTTFSIARDVADGSTATGFMHVLITGGAGFIGSHLTDRLLRDGHRVTAIDCFDSFYSPQVKRRNLAQAFTCPAFQLLELDIRDLDHLLRATSGQQFDVVVHLAARAGVRPSLIDPVLYADVNVGGTTSMLEFARRTGVSRFVFGSSSSVYGNSSQTPFVESDTATQPISPYAATKRAGELLAETYHTLYGMSIASLRFFTVYGPRQRPDLAIHKFARRMLAAEPIEVFGDGSMRRDFTYIDDIVAGICGAIQWTRHNTGHEIFNLGESTTTSVRELISLLEEALGVEATVRHLPEQPGDVKITYASVEKARRVLGYEPTTSMKEGLSHFAAWLLSMPDLLRETRGAQPLLSQLQPQA
jgi:UDP-glucuronate 4-epimerase